MGGSSKVPAAPASPYTSLPQANAGAMSGIGQIAGGPNYAQGLYQGYGGGLSGALASTTYNPQQGVDAGNYAMGQAPNMYAAGDALMGMGLDPQGSYYNQAFQQQQEQTRAGEAARGILTSPTGQGIESQQNQFFNNLWQNQQAQRASQLVGAGGNAYEQALSQLRSGLGLSTGTVGSQMGWLGQLQQAGLASYAQNQQAAQDYLNYLSQGSSAQNAAYQSQLQAQGQANQQSSQAMSGAGQAAGMALMMMMMMSDVRAKRDITRIGELPNGLGIYEFRYRNSDKYHVGVMAQEAAITNPEIVYNVDGYLHVDYGPLLEAL